VASFNRDTDYEEDMADTAKSVTAKLVYRLEPDDDDPAPITADDLEAKRKELYGWTEYNVGDGSLNRVPPMAHPERQNLFVTGVGIRPIMNEPEATRGPSDPADLLEAPALPVSVVWQSYRFELTFGNLPYAVLPNAKIQPAQTGTYYDEDGTLVNYDYFPEWLRYVDERFMPRNEILKWKYGEVIFRSTTSPPNGRKYPGLARMPMPNDDLLLIWCQVPRRYITSANSFLRKYKNRVNQTAFLGYPPGALLYETFTIDQYTAPWQQVDPTWGTGIQAAAKFVDVGLKIAVTLRDATSPPAAPANQNYIMGGWNLEPDPGTKRFYYVSTKSGSVPNFFSIPFELLFQDPDAT
jgi:hypothetical protein